MIIPMSIMPMPFPAERRRAARMIAKRLGRGFGGRPFDGGKGKAS